MNFVQKYKLYRKLRNPGPTTSNRNGSVEPDLFRIDWNYADKKQSYFIKSFCFRGEYTTDVLLNGENITTFSGPRARKLFYLAKSVMSPELVYGNTTVFQIKTR